jgi:hypothetical protein
MDICPTARARASTHRAFWCAYSAQHEALERGWMTVLGRN